MTEYEFYCYLWNKYNGRAIDLDGVAGVQCVDGFKIACKELGDPNYNRALGGDGYAHQIYYRFYENGYNEYFDLIPFEAGTLPAEIGDILVYGVTDETPYSHVSFYAGSDYPGLHYSWGQNQGGPGFNTITLSNYGVIGILRPKLAAPEPPKPQPNASGFIDVPEASYYYQAVKWAHDHGLVSGTGEYIFNPDKAITRAELCTILWRQAGSPRVAQVNPFKDVTPEAYYFQAVLWACAKGITAGTGQYFNPNAPATRAQAITFLYRLSGSPKQGSARIPYTDVQTDAYFYDAVRWSHTNQITVCANKFRPFNPCSRAQFITMLKRAADYA